jgi:hypothetical protein
MELHHHTHREHGKRNWRSYFWEFLMLFLAVFCGFLAEYQLEHKIESDREKKYMRSLVDDLMADTAMLADNIKIRQDRMQMIDTFLSILHSPTDIRQRSGDLYFLARRVSPPANIFPNDGTIQQLKSSGNLRLVQKTGIAKSIMAYDQKMRKTLFGMGDESDMRLTYREQMVKVFDTRVIIEMTKGQTILKPSGNPTLFSYDASLINELSGDIQYIKAAHRAQAETCSELLRQAVSLMQQIQKDYNL